MPLTVTLYHNNRCSKSRAALSLLQVRGVKTKVVDYLHSPPSFDELQSIFKKLGAESPRVMMRVKDDLYCELGLDNPDLSNDDLLRAVAEHPKLLERPIVVSGDKAAIGRPLENIEALL
ncbi:arsenate reductase [Neisseria animaloris]|uniref:arsenate reductase (glutaredoxin) n=1 Tax=Neisseria animaloris TaxID=326522 RepID=UPI000A196390|nr:arsenate reductase (glutaredoxin) [Neisseria animaloris]OSI07895.1 arsenate reductase (glutaredoxin) [Neisseria animaloris]VEH87675.1 arsenate reductase [Neisseria animaloris]